MPTELSVLHHRQVMETHRVMVINACAVSAACGWSLDPVAVIRSRFVAGQSDGDAAFRRRSRSVTRLTSLPSFRIITRRTSRLLISAAVASDAGACLDGGPLVPVDQAADLNDHYRDCGIVRSWVGHCGPESVLTVQCFAERLDHDTVPESVAAEHAVQEGVLDGLCWS